MQTRTCDDTCIGHTVKADHANDDDPTEYGLETIDAPNDRNDEFNVAKMSEPLFELRLAKLNYMSVNLMGFDRTFRAMRDSVGEIDVINDKLLLNLSIPHETTGKIALRPHQ